MNAIEALIQRMDQAPEEFAEDGSWKHTRWADITDIMVAESQMTPRVFTQEENVAYMSKLGAIVRKQLEEHICIEILNPLRSNEKAPQQMNLFPAQTAYPPGGGGSGQVKFSHQDYRVTVGGSGGVTVDNSALRAMVDEQIQQQKDLQNHVALHKDLLKQQKERDGVVRRMQNALKDLVKQTP
jgi:hypothetical protein